jgi:hypothetical protein
VISIEFFCSLGSADLWHLSTSCSIFWCSRKTTDYASPRYEY